MGINLFSYKHGNSLFYKVPVWLKLLLLILSTILFFFLDIKGCIVTIFTLSLFFRLQGFTFFEQLKDLRPIFIYIVFIYLVSLADNMGQEIVTEADFYKIFLLNNENTKLILRLIATVLASSLIFKTTTFLQLQSGISAIEKKFNVKTKIASGIAMVICFIPTVFQTWNNLNLSWKNRGGKNGLKKIYILIPILLSLCLENATKKAKAIQNRYFMPCEDE